MTDTDTPERIMVSACGKMIVTGMKPSPGDVEYIRAEAAEARIDGLKAEIEWHRKFVSELVPRQRRVEAAEARIAELEAALRFYAEQGNYDYPETENGGDPLTDIELDEGTVARAALGEKEDG